MENINPFLLDLYGSHRLVVQKLPIPHPYDEPLFCRICAFFAVVWSSYAGTTMNLTVWLPALFLLGLATLALMFAFLAGCEKV